MKLVAPRCVFEESDVSCANSGHSQALTKNIHKEILTHLGLVSAFIGDH